MNNLDFLLEICEPAKNLLELLKDLYDDFPQQKTNIEDPYKYLNPQGCYLEKEYSNELLRPTLICKVGKKTKKNNYIFEQDQEPYQCGDCKKTFRQSCQLGGHIQKCHKTKTNQQNLASSFQLRKRQQK